MQSITADYSERIVIPPEDVIPKTNWFKYVKVSLLTALVMLILLAILAMIISESFVQPNRRDSLAIGVVSMVGIILFSLGLVAIFKEHIPLILTFAVSMIVYLLIFMYARMPTSPGLILLRTFILLMLAIESFAFIILIRDWRQIQISRLNQRLMKEAQLVQYAAMTGGNYNVPARIIPGIIAPGGTPGGARRHSPHPYAIGPPSTVYSMSYRDENVYSQVSGPDGGQIYHQGSIAPRYYGRENYIQ